MMESDPDPRWGYPGGGSSPNTWRSPNSNYRGRGGGGYRGNGGGGQYSPRPNWRGQGGGQWTPSPHRGRGGYRPDYRSSSPYPRRGSPGGYDYRQQNFRPRNPNSSPRPRFQSTPYNPNDIECWVSPQMWEDPWAHLIHPSLLSESNNKFSVPTDCTDIGNKTEAMELPLLKSTKDAVPGPVQKSVSDSLAPESPSDFLDPELPSVILDPELPSVMETSAFEYHTALDESGLGQDSDIPSSKEITGITKIQVQEPDPVPVNVPSVVEPESTPDEAPPVLLS